MSPGKSVMDLALSKKYLAWDSSVLNDVFTTRDRSIPVIQLRRLYHSDGTEALMEWIVREQTQPAVTDFCRYGTPAALRLCIFRRV